MLEVLDFGAGQEEYYIDTGAVYQRSDAFLAVFSITDKDSFDSLSKFRDKIIQARDAQTTEGSDTKNVSMVLCGNKCDLVAQREVTAAAGSELAKSWSCPFIETSAKERINVDEAFTELVRELRKYGVPKEDKKAKKNKRCITM